MGTSGSHFLWAGIRETGTNGSPGGVLKEWGFSKMNTLTWQSENIFKAFF